jgi:subtilisin family serine protease
MKLTSSLPGWLLASSAAVLLAACGGGENTSALASAAAAAKSRSPGTTQAVPALGVDERALAGKAARDDREAATAAARARGAASRLYIVQLAEDPALVYSGGIAGYAATKPRQGQKIDPDAPAVSNYVGYLSKRHDSTLAAVGGGAKAHSYGYAFNGFAAELTAEQAGKLAATPGVLSVVKDDLRQLDTITTPNFLGLTGSTGFWNRTGAKGEDVIIGVIDGGITPEHPSFSDRTDANGNATKDGKLGYQQIPGWHGKCQPGVAFNASHCNQKLIGARFYNAGYGGGDGVLAVLPYEFISPRDYDGHGTHTASTAGGNAGVTVTGQTVKISGMAPRARIAAYKVCWGVGGTANAGCFQSDSVAAIDQAIADGVDVINFSISGTQTNFRDPVEIAFMRAAQAGVFVAASAGNSGPTTSTVAHPSPWITTVAAASHTRDAVGSVTLGNGGSYVGASMALAGLASKPFIDSTAAALPGADPVKVALCYAAIDNGGVPVLDPALVAGKTVLCDRGVTNRVNKSLAVLEAGGVGVVLVNTSNNTLNADLHSLPTVHISHTARPALKAYAATPGATVTINPATLNDNPALGPITASFSSRGPLLAGGGDLLKPDVTAPGVDIIAGVAPYTYGGAYFSSLQGTSMSSPHVAGIGALLKQLHPSWSPMAIKSALMTSAGDVIDGGTPAPTSNPVLIFRQGAGHVRPNNAADPGLVFDSGFDEWLGFLCGTQLPTSFCTDAGVPVIDPSNMNLASIAFGDLTGTQTVTRRVTNVGNASATYTASVSGMAGFTTDVSPPSLTLAKGETKSFTVRFTRTAATINLYTGGQLEWTDGTHKVRVPIVARPVALAAPVQVSASYNVTFGFDGPFTAAARGLIPAALTNGNVAQDPDQTFNPADPTGTVAVSVNVPAGSTYARFSLFDADVAAGADMDLYVYNSAGTLVGSSAGGTSAEEVNLVNPTAGTYTVFVHGWGLPAGASPFKLHAWVLGTADAGNMTVTAPASAVTGATGTITLGFSGLAAATKYLGSVAYDGAAGMPAPTIVRIDQP